MPRDYILRMIEQFGIVWRRVLKHKQLRTYEAGLADVDTTYGTMFGLNARFIDLLPDPALLDLVRDGERLDADKAGILAALHTAEGDFYTELRRIDEAFRRYERALLLYGAIIRAGDGLPKEVREPATHLLETLELYVLDPPLLDDLWRVYGGLGQYDMAENVLWNWLETVEFEPIAVADALAWYNSLLNQTHSALHKGKLPRTEIHQSIAELQTRAVDADR